MKIRSAWLAAASAAVLVSACATPAAPPPPAPPMAQAPAAPAPVAQAPARPKPKFGNFGIDLAGMDTTVQPGDDFFQYVDGNWVKTTEIPGDRSSYNSFTVLDEIATQRTQDLIQSPENSAAPAGSDARKVGDYYAGFMDDAAIEQRGLEPLKPELAHIGAIKDRKALGAYLGSTLRSDVDALNSTDLYTDRLFGLWVAEDMNDTSRYAAYLMQGGLGMPDREYYLNNTAKYQDFRAKYVAHVAKMLSLAGYTDTEAKARRILALETAIARAQWNAVDTTDVTKTNTRWTKAEFARRAPGIDWAAYFDAAGLGAQAQIGAWQPSAITGIAKAVGAAPVSTVRDYLAFHAVERGANFLPKAFSDEYFAFNSGVLSGTPEQQARWKRAIGYTNDALGEAVGKLYVAKYFSPEDKAQVQGMVKNILAAFDARIDKLDWMTPETRAKAHEKLQNFQVSVGYPDKWRDYSGLQVARDDAYGNRMRASLFEYRFNIDKLGKPVDRSEWYMVPQEVNAMYAPLQNSIIFPAAILGPPFFDPNADPAVNYGAIGGVIGHEVSHGFDNTGALFDARGNIHNWWSKADFDHFTASGEALAAQYNGYQALPDLAVNGRQTLGENIADLAGLAVAYDAYRLSLNGQPAPVIDGFTGDQRFFMGWGQNYRSKYREAALRRALLTDVHSPGQYRAQTVRNIDAWYAAFGVQPTQKLALPPEKRVRVW